MRRLWPLLLFVPAFAIAAEPPALRYNDPLPAKTRPVLAERITELARKVAAAGGHPVPTSDPRLDAALASLLPFLPDGGPPENELVQDALHRYGIIEPSPHLVVVTLVEGGDASLLDELQGRLPSVLGQGRYGRMGVAIGEARGPTPSRILLGFQESFVALLPVPRRLASRGSVALDGRLLPPYVKPELFVTSPDGTVAKSALAASADNRWNALFRCGASDGRYQIEVGGEDRFGLAVLANFPVYCGIAPPAALAPPTVSATNRPWTDAADAEKQVFELVNQDRARAGLRPLQLDPRLSEVARGHSVDMRDHDFFGHVSPTTGNADDRLKRRGIQVPLVLENIGRAYSPLEAERGLMDSPGHRGNILHPQAEKIGVGVAVAASQQNGGVRDLFVTQLFVRYAEPFRPERATDEMHLRVDEIRRDAHLGPLADDAELGKVAREVAAGLANGTLPPDKPGAPVEAAIQRLGHYRSLRTVVARASEVSQLGPSKALVDPAATHAGVAAAAGTPDSEGRNLFLVVVLGARR